jgi:gamma-glutamyltranspeptidase/glutathione hydrolase
MRVTRSTPLLVLLGLTACGGGPEERPPLSQIDRSPYGAVAAAHPLAARAGADILELGGNAVDAAVAAAFALAVVEPSMSGLGGRTQILIRLPDGRHVGIDGTTQAPASYDPDTAPEASYGYGVIGVPGTPAALLRAESEYGTLPRATLMAEAIRLAEEGHPLLPGEARRRAAVAQELAGFEGSRRHFLRPDGTPHEAGETFRQPALARTLRTLVESGAEAFYRGELAEAMVADIQAKGGHVTMEALEAYRAEDARVVTGDYRGHDLVGLWLPSYGAITIEILNLLESVDAGELPEPAWALALSEAIRIGYLDRAAQEDWDDAIRLTSEEWADQRDDLMRLEERGPAVGVSLAPGPGASPAISRAPTAPGRSVALALPADGGGHTTHLTVADSEGMVVALTQSLGPNMGSRVASPELGFLYAATLGGYLGRMEPGERARSHISPFMVERGGAPLLALGAAGGGRIPTAVAAVVSRVLDRGMTLEEALAAPRVAPEGGSSRTVGDPGAPREAALEVVPGAGAEEVAEWFTATGYTVEMVEGAGAFGRVHAVRWHPEERVWEGGADPDWEGAVAVPRGLIR